MPGKASRPSADATLDSIGDAVLSTDMAGCVTYLNHVAETMTGWSRAEAAGRPLREVFNIIDGGTREVGRNPLALAIELNKAVELTPDCILIRRDGHESAIEDSAAPIHDRQGHTIGAVIVFRNVSATLETARQMAHLAQHDPLTGLPNRLLLDDRLTQAIALALRHRKPLSVLFVDVDGFKALNDTLGHAAGDQLLRAIAERLKGALRQSDTVCRYGGDEFVALLTELESADDAEVVARKLLRAIAGPFNVESTEIRLTGSIGISLYPAHGIESGPLIAMADAAMYAAKRTGPGSFRMFDRDTVAPAHEPQATWFEGRARAGWEGEGGALPSAPGA